MLLYICLGYLALISLYAFGITVWDKICARLDKRRIPEKTLMITALLGGSASMYLTMQLIRHKTLHAKFMVGLPFIIILQIGLLFGLMWLL